MAFPVQKPFLQKGEHTTTSDSNHNAGTKIWMRSKNVNVGKLFGITHMHLKSWLQSERKKPQRFY